MKQIPPPPATAEHEKVRKTERLECKQSFNHNKSLTKKFQKRIDDVRSVHEF